MKSAKFLSASMTVCAVVLIASLFLSVSRVIGFAGGSYPHSEEYSAGDAKIRETVKNLDISWLNGTVRLAYHNGKEVILEETSNRKISSEHQMRWWLDGDTLHIRYAKSGLRITREPEKDLTVTLPKNAVLEDVHFSASSGTLMLPSVKAEQLELEVTSGSIYARANAKSMTLSSSSGSIELLAEGEAEKIVANTSSGDIQIDVEDAESVRLSATSGSIEATVNRSETFRATSSSGSIHAELGEAETAELECTSGRIRVKTDTLNTLKVRSSSGDVSVSVPKKPGFTAKIATSSGSIDNRLSLTKQGSDYICGDGSGTLDIQTTSGDIRITG